MLVILQPMFLFLKRRKDNSQGDTKELSHTSGVYRIEEEKNVFF